MSSEFFDTILLLSFAIVVGVILWTVIETNRRHRELSRQDPPSADELAAVQGLRRPGTMRLGTRESAASRHFTSSPRILPLSRFGGGQTVDSPESEGIVDSWRERRSPE